MSKHVALIFAVLVRSAAADTHLVGTMNQRTHHFSSAANRKLRCNCLLQLALTDVRYWHKADIPSAPHMSAFGGKADIAIIGGHVRL